MINMFIKKLFKSIIFLLVFVKLKPLNKIPDNLEFVKNIAYTNSKQIDQVTIENNMYARIKFYKKNDYKNELN